MYKQIEFDFDKLVPSGNFADCPYLVCMIKDTNIALQKDVAIKAKECEPGDVFKMIAMILKKYGTNLDSDIDTIKDIYKDIEVIEK